MSIEADCREARAEEEAASWLDALERSLKPSEIEPLRKWLKLPLHRKIIVDLCKFWHGPEILAVLAELIPVESFSTRVERQYGRIVLAIFLGVSGIGLATVLIAVSKIWPSADHPQNSLRAESTYTTPVGGRRTIRLPDGGTVVLNTATHLLVSYGVRSRDVTLLRGEASFDVPEDPARSFNVFAGARRFATERGPARFNLRRFATENIELLVSEGQIRALESRSRTPLAPALLRARVSHGSHTFNALEGGFLGPNWQSIWALQPQDIAKRTAWQSGWVRFTNEPLEDALAEIERYTHARFDFADVQLRELRLNAEFQTGDVDAVLYGLRANLNIGSRTDANGKIVLSRLSI